MEALAATGASLRRKTTGFAAIILASGACAMGKPDAPANNKENKSSSDISVVGRLTSEGVECQALRGDDGQLYTLLGGDLGSLPVETRVSVVGEKVEFSICQQGVTIRVRSIAPADSNASR